MLALWLYGYKVYTDGADRRYPPKTLLKWAPKLMRPGSKKPAIPYRAGPKNGELDPEGAIKLRPPGLNLGRSWVVFEDPLQ